jgi:deazaflavin-dependent oxidoreductase (nitroreductase family)
MAGQSRVREREAKERAMAETKPELPSWIADHLRRYQESRGADGHIWNGVPCLLLTTTGRKSGAQRTLPLIYGRDGDDAVIVASRGGAPEHPAWYQNLAANPRVRVQIAADEFAANARTAAGAERARLWQLMAKIWPAYDEYQAKATQREIPVVVLQRA